MGGALGKLKQKPLDNVSNEERAAFASEMCATLARLAVGDGRPLLALVLKLAEREALSKQGRLAFAPSESSVGDYIADTCGQMLAMLPQTASPELKALLLAAQRLCDGDSV